MELDAGRAPSTATATTGPTPEVLAETVAALATALKLDAAAAEPAITQAVVEAAGRSGARVADLDGRLKENDSLERKIRNRALEQNLPLEAAAGEIHDVLRYTVVLRPDQFGRVMNELLNTLAQMGHSVPPNAIANYFRNGNRYKAVHADLYSTTGYAYEIQFHTEVSLFTKRETDALYSVFRDVKTPKPVRAQILRKLIGASESIPTPEGLDELPQRASL